MTAIAANVITLGPCSLCGLTGLARTIREGHLAIAEHFAYAHPAIVLAGPDAALAFFQ